MDELIFFLILFDHEFTNRPCPAYENVANKKLNLNL